ncbi:MAG: methylenetetrahydrofolate--tRNA-(uracil(54)-C(5))-methyltransferase (FADH(2)-oxidizing) TrmFO [Clostridia bacterium]|nr:methylenetetrahydrofolate--tRNA-(uracil(54)-C(5))-methyltransferase (FADH(2)-oxidizing) TrmFO [Clostridia bacterium]
MPHIHVFGAGLAGCEAAWQAAARGVSVTLHEMKPHKMTPAHHSTGFAELVCSNSLRSDRVTNAVGLLKEELSRCGSLIMEAARATQVPAGSALAVDRVRFSDYITEKIRNHPLITVCEEEVREIPCGEDGVVVATGPLTSDAFADWLKEHIVGEGLHFFDAVAPIVDAASINMDVAFFASRYNKGDADYINCPMTREQYDAFYQALITAEEAELKDFDRDLKVFEGCMPVEVMAKRGYDTLRYGPLKPVGLVDDRTGARSYAVVQLRREDEAGSMYNLVGFQTHLTFPAQKRVFSLIPGLENADFLRYGVMHRNTYLPSPDLLGADYALRDTGKEHLSPYVGRVFFAGQMTGVEGYIESTGSGFVAGLNAARRALGQTPVTFPVETMLGAMAHYISHGGLGDFVPMNANFGIVPPTETRVKGGKLARYEVYAARALEALEGIRATL